MTDAVVSDLVVQTLYASDGTLEVSDIIVKTLRSTDSGAGTYLVVDDLIVQTLRSTAVASSGGGPMISIIM